MRAPVRPVAAVVVLTALAIVLTLTMAVAVLWDLRARDIDHDRLETTSLTRILAEQTERTFDNADQAILGVMERLHTEYGKRFPLDSYPMHLLLNARVADVPAIGSLFVIDDTGRVLNSSRSFPLPVLMVTDRPYFRAFASGAQRGLFISSPVRNRIDGRWTLHLARRLDGPQGQFAGVVVVGIDLEQLERLYGNVKLDFVRPVALYAADGQLVAAQPHRKAALGTRPPELAPGLAFPPAGREIDFAHGATEDVPGRFVLRQLKRYPFAIGVISNERDALSDWYELVTPLVSGAGLVSLFIAVVGGVLVRKLRREENLSRALHEADERYRGTINSVTDAIVGIDDARCIQVFNPAAERMFGYSARDALGMDAERLLPEGLPTQEAVAGELRAELRGARADGIEFTVEAAISRVLINGRPQLTAVLRDPRWRRHPDAAWRGPAG